MLFVVVIVNPDLASVLLVDALSGFSATVAAAGSPPECLSPAVFPWPSLSVHPSVSAGLSQTLAPSLVVVPTASSPAMPPEMRSVGPARPASLS